MSLHKEGSTKSRLRPELKDFGKRIHSQNDEDGIIEAIFEDIAPRSKFFVEFGIGPNWLDREYKNGLEGNCVLLRKNGWNGLLMDGGKHPPEYDVKREFITAFNINGLLRKYNVPENVDLISIDVDGQDLWIWMACDYRPALYVLEYNPNFTTVDASMTVPFDPTFRWDGSKYYGSSLGALIKVGQDKGYKLVYANGTNGFFLRDDLLANPQDFPDGALFQFLDQHPADHWRRMWVTV